MNEKLQEVINAIPIMKQITGVDALICVWNREGIVEKFFTSKEIPEIVLEPGYQFPDKTNALYTVMATGKTFYNKLPKEVYGKAVEGPITPIFDGREIVGAVTYCFSSEEKEEIIENTNGLTHSITKTEQSIDTIVQGIEELESRMNQIQVVTDLVRNQVEEATQVVKEIQKNANYSSILALNASIESARAGQAGRGFAVVSDEMGKFSKLSGEAATKINKNLEEIVKSLSDVKLSVDESSDIVTKQSSSINELNAMFNEVTATADKVTEICKKVSTYMG